jgi:hypothetical protein
VFGRGIVLFALVGDGISEENIEESCMFLTGPCSCQVKALNPGLDMLIKFKWDDVLMDSLIVEEFELPELEGLGEVVEAAPDVVVVTVDVVVVTENASYNSLLRNVLGLLVILALIVGGGTWAMGERNQ